MATELWNYPPTSKIYKYYSPSPPPLSFPRPSKVKLKGYEVCVWVGVYNSLEASIVNPDPNWIHIQQLWGSGSVLTNTNIRIRTIKNRKKGWTDWKKNHCLFRCHFMIYSYNSKKKFFLTIFNFFPICEKWNETMWAGSVFKLGHISESGSKKQKPYPIFCHHFKFNGLLSSTHWEGRI